MRALAEPADDALDLDLEDVDVLREELLEHTRALGAARWNADPDDVRRSVVKLVLTLVDLVRRLLERRSLKRMENGTLSPEEIERVGLALMRLEETVVEIADHFEIPPEELNLDLGPLGRLI
jgi:hypothetical protein